MVSSDIFLFFMSMTAYNLCISDWSSDVCSSDILVDTVDGVRDVDHIHACSINQERPMITLNAQLADGAVAAEVVSAIKSRLQARFGVGHATVEIVYGAAEDPACGPATSG